MGALMSYRRLKQILIKVGNTVQKQYPMINQGGCCIYATAVGKELMFRNVDASLRIVRHYGTAPGKTLPCVNQTLKLVREVIVNDNNRAPKSLDWNRFGVEFNHVIVEVDGGKYHHDTSNTRRPVWWGDVEVWDEYPLYRGEMPIYHGVDLVRDKHGWNKTFYSPMHVVQVQNTVGLLFEELWPKPR
jgi:hypothetical protein